MTILFFGICRIADELREAVGEELHLVAQPLADREDPILRQWIKDNKPDLIMIHAESLTVTDLGDLAMLLQDWVEYPVIILGEAPGLRNDRVLPGSPSVEELGEAVGSVISASA